VTIALQFGDHFALLSDMTLALRDMAFGLSQVILKHPAEASSSAISRRSDPTLTGRLGTGEPKAL
jgi:hypothetical protein